MTAKPDDLRGSLEAKHSAVNRDNAGSTPAPAANSAPQSVPAVEPTVVKEPQPGRKPLSDIKREQFAKAVVANLGNATAAARDLGYENGSAKQTGHVLSQENSVKERIAFLAEKAGLTVERVMTKVDQMMDSEDGANTRWACDRTLEFHGVRGHSEPTKTTNNLGIVGFTADQIVQLAQSLIQGTKHGA